MSQEIQETRKKISFRRNFINIMLVVVIGISSGLFLGSWYSYNMMASSADYSGLSEEALVDSYLKKLREIAKIQNRVNELTKKSVLLEGNKKAENDAQLAIAQEQLNVAQRNLEVVD